jgi:hypothetical protein
MARPQDALGRFVLGDGTPAPPPARGRKPRGPAAFKHFRVDAVLSAEERAEYERLLADPTSTAKSLQDWLRDRGHRVCRSAVSRHRKTFASELRRVRDVARMAETFCALTRREGAGAIAEAAHAKFEMMLMESLFKMPGAEQFPADQWQSMAKTVSSAVATRRSVEEMRADFERRAKAAAEEVAKASEHQATGEEVVERVRQILGV